MSTIQLEKIAKVSWGNTSITKASYVSNGYTAFSATGPDGFLENYENSSEGIVLSAIGANCGKCFWAEGKWTAIKNTITITKIDDSIILPKLLLYYLNLPSIWPRKGGGQPFISLADAKALNVYVPPIKEQKSILKQIELTTSLLDKRRQSIAKLDQLTQAIFLDMFGDPITNPNGWPTLKLENIVSEIESGWSPVCQKEKAQVGEWGVLKLSAISSGFFRDDENKALLPDVEPVEKLEARSGDLLLARKNVMELVGVSAFVFKTQGKLMLPDLIFRIRLKKDSGFTNEFLWQMFKTKTYLKYMQSFAGGTSGSMPNISKTNLVKLQLVAPPLADQKKFSDCVHAIYQHQIRNKKSEGKIKELQQSLMDSFFGEVQ